EAPDQEMADPQVVVVSEHFGDLLGCSDQRGGVAVGPGQLGDLGPQPLIDPLALLRDRQQAACAGGRVTVGRLAMTRLVLQGRRALENSLRLRPSLLLGVGDDRPNRKAEARGWPAMPCRSVVDARGHLANLCVGFPPKREGVGMLSGDL